jgi:hypothetical protein
VEQTRRRAINDYIKTLGELVPGPDKNKVAILSRSVAYIQHLKVTEEGVLQTDTVAQEGARAHSDEMRLQEAVWLREKAELERRIEEVIRTAKILSDERERAYIAELQNQEAMWNAEKAKMEEDMKEVLELNVDMETRLEQAWRETEHWKQAVVRAGIAIECEGGAMDSAQAEE